MRPDNVAAKSWKEMSRMKGPIQGNLKASDRYHGDHTGAPSAALQTKITCNWVKLLNSQRKYSYSSNFSGEV
jgi:hypothetical protein